MDGLRRLAPYLFADEGDPQESDEHMVYRLLRPLIIDLPGMHASGFFHGNIGPESILLDMENRRLVLADFGSYEARRGGGRNACLPADWASGTEKPNEQTDIHAICALFHWMVTGI